MYERPQKIKYELGSDALEPSSSSESERKRYSEAVARRLRELMRARGVTQRELARKTGLSQSHISLIAQARRSPSPLTIRKVSDALGVSPGDMLPEI